MAIKKTQYATVAVCFIIGYFAFEALLVSLISQGAGLDDAELASNVSFWNWGYGGSQPPLYTWITYALTQLFGLHFWLLQVIKFGLLASTFLAVYAGLRFLFVKPVVAAAAMLTLFLLPQLGWESQRALTHSIMGTAGSAWSFAAFGLFIRKPSWSRAVLLGLAFAAAVLGKYNGVLFLFSLIGGALFTPNVRSCLKNRYFPMAIITAIVAMMPALVFMFMHPSGVAERAGKFAIGKSGHFFADRLLGVGDFAVATLSFLSVALVVALVLAVLQKLFNAKVADNSIVVEDKAEKLLFHILVFGICLIIALVIVTGITNVKDRWLQPLLFLAPVYFTLLLTHFGPTLKYVRAYGQVGACAAIVVPFVLYFNIATAYNPLNPPVQLLDYAKLDHALRAEGPFVMMLGHRPQLLGNLRLIDPSLKTLHSGSPSVSERLKKPLMVVWTGSEKMPEDLVQILSKAGFATDGAVGEVTIGFNANTEVKRVISYLYLP